MNQLEQQWKKNAARGYVRVETAAYDPDADFDPTRDLYFKGGNAAKLFCIWSAFILPNALFIYLVF